LLNSTKDDEIDIIIDAKTCAHSANNLKHVSKYINKSMHKNSSLGQLKINKFEGILPVHYSLTSLYI